MVTWVKLRDRANDSAKPIAFFNTHFDHRGQQARLESARLIRRQIGQLGAGCAVIVTGDFNAPEGSDPYTALFGPIDEKASPIADSFRVAHPERGANEGTFSGFQADATDGGRIDWIGVSRDWKVVAADIDRTSRNGRTPSDHLPVTAVLTRQ
jgi:endonuclease/exonuclease/phosphatase family metal-dependent hydrolase